MSGFARATLVLGLGFLGIFVGAGLGQFLEANVFPPSTSMDRGMRVLFGFMMPGAFLGSVGGMVLASLFIRQAIKRQDKQGE